MKFFGERNQLKAQKRVPSTEKATKLNVEEKDRLSVGGGFALRGITKAEVSLTNDPKERTVPVVLKRFGRLNQGQFKKLSKAYSDLREAGVRVPTTYRFDEERKAIIMTDFNRDGIVALSAGNPSDFVEERTLTELPGFETVVADILTESRKAALAGYVIPSDSYFLLVDPKGNRQTGVVIGDLDTIRRYKVGNTPPDSKEIEALATQNQRTALFFLKLFINDWLTSEARQRYLSLIPQHQKEAVSY